jgi:hypothetical protein
MTVRSSVNSEKSPRDAGARRPPLVQRAPADDTPDARHKLSPARGLILAFAICAVFWLAVLGVVALLRG